MFSLFKKKAKKAVNEVKVMENRDQMEAMVGGCLLVAAADGTIDKSETDKLDKLLRSNPDMKHFGSGITQTIARFTEQLEAGFRVGRLNIMREIEDIADDRDDAESVLVNVITVAEADGEIDPEELLIINEIAERLNLRAEDYI